MNKIESTNYQKQRLKFKFSGWHALAGSLAILAIGSMAVHSLMPAPLNTDQPKITATISSGIQIPKIALPTTTDDTMCMDMIGLVVYQGNIYTQAGFYKGKDAAKIENLVGDYVGRAKGNIDEWSTQKEYSKELASSFGADIYTVKGYDSSFRLCTINTWEEEDGTTVTSIEFLENLNGISLDTGYDLFEKRLGLLSKWSSIHYQTHKDWDNGSTKRHSLSEVSTSEITAFFSELSSASFVDLNSSSIYDKPSHHLSVTLTDNTVVELRLFESGYVGYDSLGGYFVKLPKDIFDPIYNASN